MSHFFYKLRGLVLGLLIWFIYKLLALTWRLEVFEPEPLRQRLKQNLPNIFAHFHGDELVLVNLISRYKIATITSTSKDGELMTTVVHLLGGKTSRGSSTRGGASALRGLIQICKNGANSSFAVDGPKGPIHEVKPGVFELSRLMKSPLFVGGVYCSSAWRFPKSWNQTYLPKPFSKIQVVWMGPYGPVSKDDDPRSEVLAKTLQNQLFDARQQAAKVFGDSRRPL